MPSKAGLKRTIKLRQPNAQGREFIKVNSKDFSYPIFDWLPNWFAVGDFTNPKYPFNPGVAGLNDWVNAYQNYQEEQANQAAVWLRPFSFGLSNSQIQWLVQNPLAPDPGAAGFEGWGNEIERIVTPAFAEFTKFIFDNKIYTVGGEIILGRRTYYQGVLP